MDVIPPIRIWMFIAPISIATGCCWTQFTPEARVVQRWQSCCWAGMNLSTKCELLEPEPGHHVQNANFSVEETSTKPGGRNQIAAQRGFQNSGSKRRVLNDALLPSLYLFILSLSFATSSDHDTALSVSLPGLQTGFCFRGSVLLKGPVPAVQRTGCVQNEW